jgi:hypothetical protein
MMKSLVVVSCAIVALARAGTEEAALKTLILQSLGEAIEQSAEVEGVQNCENKCDKVFQKFAYEIATTGEPTFEFKACMEGCNTCAADLLKSPVPADNCFTTCKNTDWKSKGILKGVIEPDKACIAGCVIQTCQVMCSGGTPDAYSAQTAQYYYPNGGCSIKTEPYSQNFEYVPWDSPTGPGANNEPKRGQCCANALSLCDYVGNTNTQNYNNLEKKTQTFCKGFVKGNPPSKADICSFFLDPLNCGNT